MTWKIYHQFLLLIFIQKFNCLNLNPALGILTESNLYLANILEFNSTNDHFHLIYHHNDPVYSLQSFTLNELSHEIYLCSPTTIYKHDLQNGSNIIPLFPIDDTPCRTNLIYLSKEKLLFWGLRYSIIQFDVEHRLKQTIWNSTSIIRDIIYNTTNDDMYRNFYLTIQNSDDQFSIVHCRTNRQISIRSSFQSCVFLDHGYHDISALVIDKNQLYVADRLEQKIYVLSISNNSILTKTILPISPNIIADIRSMFIYNRYLIWLTTSGHIRLVSLDTYQVRNIFWIDEQLRTIRLVYTSQWPNPTTTTTAKVSSTSTREQIDIVDNNSWKITAYLTSIMLGFILFICAILVSYVLLNNRLKRTTNHSFTSIFHIRSYRTLSDEL